MQTLGRRERRARAAGSRGHGDGHRLSTCHNGADPETHPRYGLSGQWLSPITAAVSASAREALSRLSVIWVDPKPSYGGSREGPPEQTSAPSVAIRVAIRRSPPESAAVLIRASTAGTVGHDQRLLRTERCNMSAWLFMNRTIERAGEDRGTVGVQGRADCRHSLRESVGVTPEEWLAGRE